MKGIRGLIGHALINEALGQFESIAKKFQDGIHHCTAEIGNHAEEIEIRKAKIIELNQHVEKAQRVLGKIHAFVE